MAKRRNKNQEEGGLEPPSPGKRQILVGRSFWRKGKRSPLSLSHFEILCSINVQILLLRFSLHFFSLSFHLIDGLDQKPVI
jgi:hypothetical protein